MSANNVHSDSLIHDIRRGEIVWVLKQDYPHLVTFRHLQLALRDRNVPLSQKDLEGYLSYLEENGYVRCERRFCEKELENWILAVALTARGILMFDKKTSDPGVLF